MTGPFSFLPLSNKPGLKTRVQARNVAHDMKEKVLPEHRNRSGAETETLDNDNDEWYDTTSASSEGGNTPKKNKRLNKAHVNNSLVSVKAISPEEEEKLLPYMPALFDPELPPCGPEVQVAYEIVNARLRENWLNHRGQRSTIEICQNFKDFLRNQDYLWPPFMLKGPVKKRKPWRRENVFKYELYWIEYFLREAQQQAPQLMTESELMDRRMQSEVPIELRFHIDRPDLLKLWEEWNKKKRAQRPALPGLEEEVLSDDSKIYESNEQDSKADTVDQDAKESVEEPKNEPASFSANPPSRRVHTDGASDDAYLWSQGGHD